MAIGFAASLGGEATYRQGDGFWRRGGDSDAVWNFRICKLLSGHCSEYQRCHRSRGGLHHIAPRD